MFYRKCGCMNNYNCADVSYNESDLECKCSNVKNNNMNVSNSCSCGFDEEDNGFPENAMFAQSYVPFQTMNKVYKPEVGLKNGTIFPELVSLYCPNQSIEEINYIKMNNTIGEGCNG